VLILHYFDQFCMVLVFLDVLQDFNPLAVAGSQSAFAFAPLRFAACSTSWAGLAPALLANRAAPVGLLSWIALGSFAFFGRSTDFVAAGRRKTLRRGGSPLLFVGCFSGEIEKGPDGGLSTSEEFHSVRNVELGINSALRTPNS